jgi:hypothetical protein
MMEGPLELDPDVLPPLVPDVEVLVELDWAG